MYNPPQAMEDLKHLMDLSGSMVGMTAIATESLIPLVVSAILGGIIGLEREFKHKPAGLRTQMFICFGAALFTILSRQLASVWGGDHTRIAAQIIPGIGFIGAGSILHDRGSVTGITTAATIFVTASVGMAVGGGLYLTAVFATIVILIALAILGRLESRLPLRPRSTLFEVIGNDADAVVGAVNSALEDQRLTMQTVQITRIDHSLRMQFSVEASRFEQEALLRVLRQSSALKSIQSLGATEKE